MLCSGERRTDLVWGLWRVRAGQRGRVMPVGAAVFIEVDARKDIHGALYMEILIIRDSETQIESHPLVGNPHPCPSLGFSQISGNKQGAPA